MFCPAVPDYPTTTTTSSIGPNYSVFVSLLVESALLALSIAILIATRHPESRITAQLQGSSSTRPMGGQPIARPVVQGLKLIVLHASRAGLTKSKSSQAGPSSTLRIRT